VIIIAEKKASLDFIRHCGQVDWNISNSFRHTPFVKGLGLGCPWDQFNLKVLRSVRIIWARDLLFFFFFIKKCLVGQKPNFDKRKFV
jgi:hypothetical protein